MRLMAGRRYWMRTWSLFDTLPTLLHLAHVVTHTTGTTNRVLSTAPGMHAVRVEVLTALKTCNGVYPPLCQALVTARSTSTSTRSDDNFGQCLLFKARPWKCMAKTLGLVSPAPNRIQASYDSCWRRYVNFIFVYMHYRLPCVKLTNDTILTFSSICFPSTSGVST